MMTRPFAASTTPHILLVKTSSLGDVLHNLPVVSDIVRHYPDAQIDWVVEESFAALPGLHPGVRTIIPVAVRRWRKKMLDTSVWREIGAYRHLMAAQNYDVAIDTQGLLKSAVLMRAARGMRCGFDRHSAREPLAAFLYQQTFPVDRGQHAVERNRQLVAQALGYTLGEAADYGIRPPALPHFSWLTDGSYAVLLHATSRDDKLWSEANWVTLGRYLHAKKIRCVLPWGNAMEQARSRRLAVLIADAVVPPRLNLNEVSALLGGAQAVIGVDTGLAHLAAALGALTIGIYTATDPALTGLYAGRRAINLGNLSQTPDAASVIDILQQAAVC